METITINITGNNMNMLNALIKYAIMLDHVTHAEETLNVDGIVNDILSDGMKKEIKDIVNRHGFMGVEDFIETITACHDGEEVEYECHKRELSYLQRKHDKILSQIPIDDKQMNLKFDDEHGK